MNGRTKKPIILSEAKDPATELVGGRRFPRTAAQVCLVRSVDMACCLGVVRAAAIIVR